MAITKVTRELLSTGIDDNSNATAITIDSSENVGIGITSSLEKFTVSNSSSGIVGRFTNNTNQTLDLGVISGSGAAGGVYYNSANSGYHAFQVGGNQKMRLDSDGNLGMGTNPATGVRLDIRNDSTTTLADFRNANSSGYGLYVAGGSSSSQYAFRAADKDNTALFSVLSDGSVTKPKQPAFSATASYSNIPLASATTMTLSSERFDTSSDLSGNVFTAPVTGKYLFTYLFYFFNVAAAHTTFDVHIKTSNKQYQVTYSPDHFIDTDSSFSVTGSIIADMDANDTCYFSVYCAGGSAQTSLHGDSQVSGCLLM